MSKDTINNALPAFHLLIPAAGLGTRIGNDIPKQYIKIMGKTVLEHTLDKFYNHYDLLSVTIIIDEAHHDFYTPLQNHYKNLNFVSGSKTRKKSVYNGLDSLSHIENNDIILIHDAARMMVQRHDIDALLKAMIKNDAATLASPLYDSIVQDNKTLNRESLYAIQTPQAFQFALIKKAHESFKDDASYTDDASLVRDLGHKVEIIPASRHNIKITTNEDLEWANKIMTNTYETRVGSGFDVHAFERETTARKLMLGGIHIEHEYALAGHSDADVVLHAITDALLGTINKGDIGTLFPPSDPQWKDMDSAHFLSHTIDLLSENNVIVNFIDVTIMAEEPKIGPHRDAMQQRIAEITTLDKSRISIKATTTEKLGFTGRKEGIACQAIATVQIPC